MTTSPEITANGLITVPLPIDTFPVIAADLLTLPEIEGFTISRAMRFILSRSQA